jgi:hypothetical protein
MELFKDRHDLSPLSIKTYTSCLLKIFDVAKLKNGSEFIEKPKYIIDCLDKYYENDNSKKTKLGAILSYIKGFMKGSNPNLDKEIKDASEIYMEHIDKYNSNIKNRLATHKKTPEEEKNWTTKDDIQKITDHLKAQIPPNIQTINDLNKFRNYIIYILYQDIPSRLDIADSKILYKSNKELNDEYNYIELDKKKKIATYYMNEYKTKKTYGSKEIKLNNELYTPLNDYMKELKKFNKDGWLLLNDKGQKLTRNALSKIYSSLGAVVGKKLGVSANRHIAISNLVPIDKMQRLADIMGNSINEQIQTYAKKE